MAAPDALSGRALVWVVHAPAEPIEDGRWESSALYRRGVELFNAGYYWEAHEAWEPLWHAHGRRGVIADILRALIKLAAAGVKVLEGRPDGVRTHASRAAALFAQARDEAGPYQLGLDLDEWIDTAASLAASPPPAQPQSDTHVTPVFTFSLNPVSGI